MNHTGFNHVAMNQARKVKGEQECQCDLSNPDYCESCM